MLDITELARIKMRAEHIVSLESEIDCDNLTYLVLLGDAKDTLSLLNEIEELRRRFHHV